MRLALILLVGCGRVSFDGVGDAPRLSDGVADSDLLLHFTFESDGFLRDRAGTRDATCTTCPTATPGPVTGTRAAQFDGTACLNVEAGFLTPPSITWAVWVRLVDARNETMFGRPYDSTNDFRNTFELWTGVSPTAFIAEVNSNGRVEVPFQFDEWHHLAATFDGSTFTTYRDGVLVGSAGAQPLLYTNEGFTIGCDRDFGIETTNMAGALDSVRLYRRVLTASEVAALFAAGG